MKSIAGYVTNRNRKTDRKEAWEEAEKTFWRKFTPALNPFFIVLINSPCRFWQWFFFVVVFLVLWLLVVSCCPVLFTRVRSESSRPFLVVRGICSSGYLHWFVGSWVILRRVSLFFVFISMVDCSVLSRSYIYNVFLTFLYSFSFKDYALKHIWQSVFYGKVFKNPQKKLVYILQMSLKALLLHPLSGTRAAIVWHSDSKTEL